MSRYSLNTQKGYASSYSVSKTSYLSKPTINTPSNTGTSAASTIACITTIPATVKRCQPLLPTRPCPRSLPTRDLPALPPQPSLSPLNNLQPLWLRCRPLPSCCVPPKFALNNLQDSPRTCSKRLYTAWWPPSGKEISKTSLNKTRRLPASKSSKTELRRSSRYRMTCTPAQRASKPTMTVVPLMPEYLTKMATSYPRNGYDTSTMGRSPPTVGQKTVPMFGCFGKIELEQIKKIK